MKTDRPLLTIAIPTFNRVRFLRELLSVLFDQLIAQPRVELIVSDNASSDETPILLQEFQDRGLQIRYIRNKTNIGADANFLQCFELARGKYVWIVGDDDIIPSGALDRVLYFLDSGDFDLIFLRPMPFDEQPLAKYKPDPRGREAFRIRSASLFCRMVGIMFTLITCNIINKQRFEKLIPALDHGLLETNLVQLGWVYPLVANFVQGLYVFDYLISVRAANGGGYSVSRVFGKNFKQITDNILGPGSPLARAMHQEALSKCLPFLVLEVRQHRFIESKSEDFHATLKPIYGKMGAYWFYVFPVAACPLWFAGLWYRFIQQINSVTPALQLLKFYLDRPKKRRAW
jgi:glycosyltransferase involved in cell wall biosynthesis